MIIDFMGGFIFGCIFTAIFSLGTLYFFMPYSEYNKGGIKENDN